MSMKGSREKAFIIEGSSLTNRCLHTGERHRTSPEKPSSDTLNSEYHDMSSQKECEQEAGTAKKHVNVMLVQPALYFFCW